MPEASALFLKKQGLTAEKPEQWQQRQAEDGEMIAIDPLEQMYAKAFELVGPRRCRVGSGSCWLKPVSVASLQSPRLITSPDWSSISGTSPGSRILRPMTAVFSETKH
jgi:hypothetical protein